MKLKNFFWTSEIVTSFFWVVFFLVIIFINPNKTNAGTFILFYISLFLAIMGTVSLLELRIILKKRGTEEIKKKTTTSIRHGLMVAFVLVGLLFMEGIDVLTLWDGIILFLAILLIEAYFWSKES